MVYSLIAEPEKRLQSLAIPAPVGMNQLYIVYCWDGFSCDVTNTELSWSSIDLRFAENICLTYWLSFLGLLWIY